MELETNKQETVKQNTDIKAVEPVQSAQKAEFVPQLSTITPAEAIKDTTVEKLQTLINDIQTMDGVLQETFREIADTHIAMADAMKQISDRLDKAERDIQTLLNPNTRVKATKVR